MTTPDLQNLRNRLVDEESCLEIARASVQVAMHDRPQDISPEAWSHTSTHAELIACGNVRRIFAGTESELETLFLTTFLIAAIHSDPFSLVVTLPFRSAAEALAAFRETAATVKELSEQFALDFPDENVLAALDEFGPSAGFTHDEIMAFKTHALLYQRLGLDRSFHLTPQAGFSDITVEGRTIRVDLLVWVPSEPSFQIVVECDGFQFHSDKQAFTQDRIRDRVLQVHGFNVFRFSGTEIYRDPVRAASELLELLHQARKGAG